MFAYFGFNDESVDTYRAVLLKCGAGKIWPKLAWTREQRRMSETLVGSTMRSRGSFMDKLDLVDKAMKFFDAGARKDSTVTLGDGYVSPSFSSLSFFLYILARK